MTLPCIGGKSKYSSLVKGFGNLASPTGILAAKAKYKDSMHRVNGTSSNIFVNEVHNTVVVT